MNNLKRLFCCIVSLLTYSAVLFAQDSNWEVNPHDYQYDMTVYLSFTVDGKAVDMKNYKVAAFAGGKCRGVGQVMEKDGKTWIYLRVYSNDAADEHIQIRIFDPQNQKELRVQPLIIMNSSSLIGLPSSPMTVDAFVNSYKNEDVNHDGVVDTQDILTVYDFIRSIITYEVNPYEDVNGDGVVDTQDVLQIYEYMKLN